MTITSFTPNEILNGFISSDNNTVVLGEAGRFDDGANIKVLQSVVVAVKK